MFLAFSGSLVLGEPKRQSSNLSSHRMQTAIHSRLTLLSMKILAMIMHAMIMVEHVGG